MLSIWNAGQNYCSEGGRAFRAHNMVDDYSAGEARSWHDSLFTMMSSDVDRDTLATVSSALLDGRNIGPNVLDQSNVGGGQGPRWGDARTSSPPLITVWADLFNFGCHDGSLKPRSPTGSKAQKGPYGLIGDLMSKLGGCYMGVTFGPMESLVVFTCISPSMAGVVNY